MINFDNAHPATKPQAMIIRPDFTGWGIAMLLLAFQIPASPGIAEVEIKTARHKFLEENSFQRLSELFTGKENRGRRAIVRTHADIRAGEYFIITLNQSVHTLPENSRLKLEIITGESMQEKEFLLHLPSGMPQTREIFAGITGNDWKQNETKILAWRLTLQDAQGSAIAKKESFLWKSP